MKSTTALAGVWACLTTSVSSLAPQSVTSPAPNICIACHSPPGLSRRDGILVGFSAFTVLLHPSPSHAAANAVLGGATSTAKVSTWPGIEGLEPMYELKLSVDAMTSSVLNDTTSWPFVQKRLDRYFKGFLLSEKNFYFGVGLQYMNDMQYAPGELPDYVLLDKQTRYNALEQTMENMESLRKALSTGDAAAIEGYAKASQAALSTWFAMVPEKELKDVKNLFEHVKKADLNRNGRLEENELTFLSPEEQATWKKRVDKFG